MFTWLIRRLIQAGFVVLAMTVIVFIGVHIIGNPVDILISPEADQAERARIIAEMGFDRPLWEQYFIFVKDAMQGNLGRSFVFNEPALKLIAGRMPATLELVAVAALLALAMGIPLGVLTALRRHSGDSGAVFHLLRRAAGAVRWVEARQPGRPDDHGR